MEPTDSQPPPSSPPPPPTEPATGLEPNIAAALAYLWVPAIVFLVLEPYSKDRFVRFHSLQSVVLGGAWVVASLVLSLIPILGWMLLLLMPVAGLILFIICVLKAYQKEWFKLPVIGEWALSQVGKA